MVLYTRASAPCVMISSASCEKGAGSVWSGRDVSGGGGGSIGGTTGGSAIAMRVVLMGAACCEFLVVYRPEDDVLNMQGVGEFGMCGVEWRCFGADI